MTYIDYLINDAKQVGEAAVKVQHAEWGGYYVTILGGRVSEIFETETLAEVKANEYIARIIG